MIQNDTPYLKKLFSKIKGHFSFRKVVSIILVIIAFIFDTFRAITLVLGYLGALAIVMTFLSGGVKISLITFPFTKFSSAILTGDKEMLNAFILILKMTIISFLLYYPLKGLDNYFKYLVEKTFGKKWDDLIG